MKEIFLNTENEKSELIHLINSLDDSIDGVKQLKECNLTENDIDFSVALFKSILIKCQFLTPHHAVMGLIQGKKQEETSIIEYTLKDISDTFICTYDKEEGKLAGLKIKAGMSDLAPYNLTGENADDKTAIFLCLMPRFEQINVIFQEINTVIRALCDRNTPVEKDHLLRRLNAVHMSIQTAMVDSANRKQDDTIHVENSVVFNEKECSLRTIKKMDLTLGKLNPTKLMWQTSEQRVAIGGIQNQKNALGSNMDKYAFNNWQYTEEEQKLIPKIPETHIISETELNILEDIHQTRDYEDEEMKIMSIYMEGGSGGGKTQTCRALAGRLGLPYVTIVCSPNMDEDNLLYTMLPEGTDRYENAANEKDQKLINYLMRKVEKDIANDEIAEILELPTLSEAYYDPIGCYEKLTGMANENVEGSKVIAMLMNTISSECERVKAAYKNNGGGMNFRLVLSPILEAYKNGYFVEVQEPACIKDGGVLTALNGILDRAAKGIVTTPRGNIKKHKNFMIAFTTNRNYHGCRPINQSVRNRFQYFAKVETPKAAIMVQRGLARFRDFDSDLAKKLADAVIEISAEADKQGISGVSGMRNYYNLISAVHRGKSIEDAMMTHVIYAISTEEDEVEQLVDIFAATECYSL